MVVAGRRCRGYKKNMKGCGAIDPTVRWFDSSLAHYNRSTLSGRSCRVGGAEKIEDPFLEWVRQSGSPLIEGLAIFWNLAAYSAIAR